MRTEKRLVLATAFFLLTAAAPGVLAEPAPAATPSFLTCLGEWLELLWGASTPSDSGHQPGDEPPGFIGYIIPGG